MPVAGGFHCYVELSFLSELIAVSLASTGNRFFLRSPRGADVALKQSLPSRRNVSMVGKVEVLQNITNRTQTTHTSSLNRITYMGLSVLKYRPLKNQSASYALCNVPFLYLFPGFDDSYLTMDFTLTSPGPEQHRRQRSSHLTNLKHDQSSIPFRQESVVFYMQENTSRQQSSAIEATCFQKKLQALRPKKEEATSRRSPANCHRRGLQQMAHHPLGEKSRARQVILLRLGLGVQFLCTRTFTKFVQRIFSNLQIECAVSPQ
ncbi:unnamed protein product [Heterotrigona itama]|uniref:Uncharacterized protein n=1 Tax=Heterotrigona itama TaxID=395501 RepID=A0A6V7HAU1_9HYME|nr:unnamed protein product [Heterotrigona itama]